MATKVSVLLVDDLDGGEADTIVAFALDGTNYEIDLSEANAEDMADTLRKYVAAARKVSSPGRKAAAPGKPFSGVDNAAVRAWAKSAGIEVSPRGRIKADVIEQFRAAGH